MAACFLFIWLLLNGLCIMMVVMKMVERAYAKINLGIDTLYKREDGYHEVEMIMHSLELYDKIILEKRDDNEIVLSSNRQGLPLDKRNHVYQAVELVKDYVGIDFGVDVHIHKIIPIQAGLAGGSTDAAATIKGLNRMFRLGLKMNEMESIAEKIGSDVPYCLHSNLALATGRGEVITPLESNFKSHVLIVKPKFGASTKVIYGNLNVDEVSHPDITKLKNALLDNDLTAIYKEMGNSLQDVTTKLYPPVQDLINELETTDAKKVLMSGSGPSVFAIYDSKESMENAAKLFNKRKYFVYRTQIR
jgi:4-diphosphocytidyl-2-C-methyl-D-erythritol kinase